MTGRTNEFVATRLCLACGICCNGVLFGDVELQPADDAQRLRALGMPCAARRKGTAKTMRFPQPCPALEADCRCRIYAERPGRCREFECVLFKKVAAGKLESASALRTIRKALQLAQRVQSLLAELGDLDSDTALSIRFQRMRKRIHETDLTEERANLFADLTLAVNELNLVLRKDFYPAAGDAR